MQILRLLDQDRLLRSSTGLGTRISPQSAFSSCMPNGIGSIYVGYIEPYGKRLHDVCSLSRNRIN